MKKYLITTTNEYGDANNPVILHAENIEDAVLKFRQYVIETIDTAFVDIDIDASEDTDTVINRLRDMNGVRIETTLIRINLENDNGDEWTEWNLYDIASLDVIGT